MSSVKYESEGFDLDSKPSTKMDASGKEIVYEIGSKVSINLENDVNEDGFTTETSEELKSKGNKEFKTGNFLDAYDFYSDAINSCPGPKGVDILQQKSDHEQTMMEKAHQSHLMNDTDRQQQSQAENVYNLENDNLQESSEQTAKFQVPHKFGDKLSVYHCNRAASLLHLCRYEEAIEDCNIALLLNSKYTKALIRRMTAYEKIDRVEEALRDAKEALSLDKNSMGIRKHVSRLQKIEDERMKKLKEETMGKLKDLGNSILSNFGMNLDNFKAEKDPNTGSYNISYQT